MENNTQLTWDQDNNKPVGYLTTEEAAAVLGANMASLRVYASSGKIRSVKVGRNRYIKEEDLSLVRICPSKHRGKKPTPDGYMTKKDAAEKWGVSASAISQFIKRGQLEPAMIDGAEYIPECTERPVTRRAVPEEYVSVCDISSDTGVWKGKLINVIIREQIPTVTIGGMLCVRKDALDLLKEKSKAV